MSITQDQHKVQTLASDTTNKSLTVSVGFGSTERGMNDLNACPFSCLFKMSSILVIIVTDQKLRPRTKGCCLPELLGNPFIGW